MSRRKARFRVGTEADVDADLLRRWASVLMGDPDGEHFVVEANGTPLARFRDIEKAQALADQANQGEPALA